MSLNFKDPRDIIVAPVVSEKTYGLMDEGKYTFLVDQNSNKTEIKQAIESIFDVQVAKVNTLNRQGKRRRTRTGWGKRKDTKRAIVALKDGSIDIFGGSLYALLRQRRTRLMGIRKHKPTTPGRRGSSVADFVEVTRSTPEKSLLRPLHKHGGRNSQGRVTTRHQGGGHKRQYRVIDFRRHDKDGVPAKVAHIEY